MIVIGLTSYKSFLLSNFTRFWISLFLDLGVGVTNNPLNSLFKNNLTAKNVNWRRENVFVMWSSLTDTITVSYKHKDAHIFQLKKTTTLWHFWFQVDYGLKIFTSSLQCYVTWPRSNKHFGVQFIIFPLNSEWRSWYRARRFSGCKKEILNVSTLRKRVMLASSWDVQPSEQYDSFVNQYLWTFSLFSTELYRHLPSNWNDIIKF